MGKIALAAGGVWVDDLSAESLTHRSAIVCEAAYIAQGLRPRRSLRLIGPAKAVPLLQNPFCFDSTDIA